MTALGLLKLDTFIMIKGLTVSHVVKSALCIAIALTVGCSAIKEHALKSVRAPDTGRQTAHLDAVETIDAEWVHSARRADRATIAAYWQMDEPVWLSSLLYAKEVYRLWYKPSLYDWSVVRVVRDNNAWILSVRTQDSRDRNKISKCLFSKAQLDPMQCRYPALKTNSERKLQAQEIEQLAQHLVKLDFWNQPEQVKSLPEFDGVDWTLESVREDGQTREVYRHSPPENEAFYQFADFLLKLAEVPQP